LLEKRSVPYPEKSEATALRNFHSSADDSGSIAIVDISGSGKFAIASLSLYEANMNLPWV